MTQVPAVSLREWVVVLVGVNDGLPADIMEHSFSIIPPHHRHRVTFLLAHAERLHLNPRMARL